MIDPPPNVPIPKRKIRQAMLSALLEAIRSGRFRRGQRLPSSRELAERYNTSHVTASYVLNELVKGGYVTKRRGIGMFVARSFNPARGNVRIFNRYGMTDPLRPAMDSFAQHNPAMTVTVDSRPGHADVHCLGPSIARYEAIRGNLMPLDDLMADDGIARDEFHPTSINVGTVSGKTYALPFWFSNYVLFVNTSLVPRRVLETAPEWTTGSFLEVVRELAGPLGARGIQPYGTSELFSGFVVPFLTQFGGRILDDSLQHCLLASPESLETFAYATELYHSIAKLKGKTHTTITHLKGGRAAIIHSPAGHWSVFPRRKFPRLRMMPMPPGRFPAGRIVGMWLCIPATCEEPERAWTFIRECVSARTQHVLRKTGNLFPTRRDVLEAVRKSARGILAPAMASLDAPDFAVTPMTFRDWRYLDVAFRGWHAPDLLPSLLERAIQGFHARSHTFPDGANPDADLF